MDIFFGKPGGGKGVGFAFKAIVWLMENPDGAIVGNFAFKLSPWLTRKKKSQIGLVGYLEKWFRKSFDIDRRFFPLTDEQTQEFYRYRVNEDWKLYEAAAERDDRRKVCTGFDIDACTKSRPILYLVDEAGQIFGSREWANTGAGALFYAAQHRKLGDETWLCSQSYKDIDVALIRKCQFFIHCKNRGKLRAFWFRQPDDFIYAIYDHIPTGLPGDKPMDGFTIKKDEKGLDLLQTFDTTAGVGMRQGGGHGDMDKKTKGIPWKVFITVLCLFPVVTFTGFWFFLTRVQAHYRQTQSPKNETGAGQHLQTNGYFSPGFGLPGFDLDRVRESGRQVSTLTGLPVEQPAEIVCEGWTQIAQTNGKPRMLVTLSDGRTADSAYGEVQRVERWSVRVFGETFKMKLKVSNDEVAWHAVVGGYGPNINVTPSTGLPGFIGTPADLRADIVTIGSRPGGVEKINGILPMTHETVPFTPGIHSATTQSRAPGAQQ